MIDGISAEGYRQVDRLPRGAQGNEQTRFVALSNWYSPDLELTILIKIADSRNGERSTLRLTNIKPGEPDPSLFQVPAGYRTIEEKSAFAIDYALR